MNSYSDWFFARLPVTRELAAPRRTAHARCAQAGFTLLEILIVLVILGLVAAVVAGPQVFKYLGTAKSEAAKVQLERVAGALDLYRLEVGRYPSQQESLTALVDPPAGLPNWNGPYLKKREAIIDPWGRPLNYRIPGQYGEYDLYTLGADNAVGGDGENRDITNY
ncbi:MAG: type II secretion system major pseudopilin GspG [Rhodospirillales bacterium]|jgi:general secretion pathway protein G|nr:type II secretion system major pseudopilin GspG [Rhodospirillales bacterium]